MESTVTSRPTTRPCTTAMSSSGVSVHRRTGCEMGRGWRAVVEAGLGDARTRILGVFLIIVAVVGAFLMHSYANIETVFAASLLAGSLLGRWGTILRPLTALAVLPTLLGATTYVWDGRNADFPIPLFRVSRLLVVRIPLGR